MGDRSDTPPFHARIFLQTQPPREPSPAPVLAFEQPERHQMSFRKVPILSSEIAMLPMPPIGVSLQMVVTDEAGNFYRWPLTAYELTSVGE
jgi:hypothetical protein